MLEQMKSRFRRYREGIDNLGLVPGLLYKFQQQRSRRTNVRSAFVLRSRYAKHPLTCRPNTSDIDVFEQIFVTREYRCLDDVADAGLIIDCGANVGLSASYFLSRFPNARVIAVEPDRENFHALQANLAPYGGRYSAVCSAIWSHAAPLVLAEGLRGDDRAWARTVREARAGETPTILATDIGTLLKGSGHDRISILKIDIEGSEAVVFSANYEGWLDKVDNLVIELHGDTCRSIFGKAIAGRGFAVTECGELTVCRSGR